MPHKSKIEFTDELWYYVYFLNKRLFRARYALWLAKKPNRFAGRRI